MITRSEFDRILAMTGKTVRDRYTGIQGKAIGFSRYDEFEILFFAYAVTHPDDKDGTGRFFTYTAQQWMLDNTAVTEKQLMDYLEKWSNTPMADYGCGLHDTWIETEHIPPRFLFVARYADVIIQRYLKEGFVAAVWCVQDNQCTADGYLKIDMKEVMLQFKYDKR